MLMEIRMLIFCVVLCSTIKESFSQDCGVERWKIKTLSDTDTMMVKFDSVITSTVHEQVNIEAPFGRLFGRIQSEYNVYSVECFLIGYKSEDDHDIHIIVEDIATDETMIVEIVDPECQNIKNNSRFPQMSETYLWFLKNIGKPGRSFIFLQQHPKVIITGVGFWDYLHGQKGMANNGRELHPVLKIQLTN